MGWSISEGAAREYAHVCESRRAHSRARAWYTGLLLSYTGVAHSYTYSPARACVVQEPSRVLSSLLVGLVFLVSYAARESPPVSPCTLPYYEARQSCATIVHGPRAHGPTPLLRESCTRERYEKERAVRERESGTRV
jgi:hypothetical protein